MTAAKLEELQDILPVQEELLPLSIPRAEFLSELSLALAFQLSGLRKSQSDSNLTSSQLITVCCASEGKS